MENKKWEDLTPKQQEELTKLIKSSKKRGAIMGLQMSLVFIVSNVLLVMLNAVYVQSQTFGIIGGIINGIMLFSFFKNSVKQEHDRIQAEVKNILEK